MAKLSSRKLHIEIDVYVPATDTYVKRSKLPDAVKAAVKDAVATLRSNGIPIEKTAWEYDYHYRSRNGHGSGVLRRIANRPRAVA